MVPARRILRRQRDLVQVKYEMLRHARQDGVTKADAASLFGLSRPTKPNLASRCTHAASSGRSLAKKTLTHSSANSWPRLPSDAAAAYERVRADVLLGQARPDALGAIVFHGMWHGLRVLLNAAVAPSLIVPPTSTVAPTGTLDRQLVRLLADMVLATQLEVRHAYAY